MNHQPAPAARPARPATWLPDPLDDALLRYWDGYRWTFHTAARPTAPPAEAEEPRQQTPNPPARPDVAAALDRVRGALVGSMKEINLLPDHLQPEERVLALASALGDGFGVLACTDRRLLFLFVGILRKQFLHISWNEARAVRYDQSTKIFAVYTTKPTKRAVPALAVRVAHLEDARAVAHAAQTASAAPRLDVI
ncbi:DUF2510 domain-containing protein [Saccharopolyspora hirsuta]|uniref:DUF2510 domain-containing protein n=1 Tax=Saccharopolyspora hirsuta TaxID=1837 RepID=A0A5M7CA36_SACHI|nr:DUF2510 domain-containing protein [Saccharopolyspora hirsuta]KAA5835215.1 DUF2510 domain-containing protein [Saccharopolyspora hirsuta]